MPNISTLSAKAASRLRRRLLALLMKLPGGHADPASLLARFPDEALMPLRRTGLDPVPALAAVREREPVTRLKMPLGLRGWLVTGYEESKTVLAADTKTFSNDFGNMIGKVGIGAEQDPGGLGFADPPHHTRLRKLLAPHFTTRALARRTDRVREIIDDALDDMARAGATGAAVDLQQHFALQIPSRVIMELLGIDDADRDEFQRLSAERFDFAGGAAKSLNVIQESIDLLREIVAKQRVAPGPGLIGAILTEHGDDIDDVELAGLADGVLTGGLETTVSMLALGAIVLLEDAALFERLRTDDAAAEPFVEELLRYLTVVQVGFPRFAVRDTVLGGKSIFAGDVVLCSLSGANRDARLGPEMEQVRLDRPPVSHLAFGHGLHRCVGAELARIELRMAYPMLVRRFPALRLARPAAELKYRELSFVYGLEKLPVLVG
ncbi:MAG TPA: cytochrome P450 [Jatrophihabitans sp.]|nr:cytochrome P450 [Jatrophihabitans sp.]